jgi:C-terminal processing protease CtpA/Prc
MGRFRGGIRVHQKSAWGTHSVRMETILAEAARVIVGDRIVSTDGHASADLGPEALANYVYGASGTPVAMEVERGEEKFTQRMKTRQLICESRQ